MADDIDHSVRVESYEINGRRYERLEDVPAELRRYFVDANGNGIPDFFEDLIDGDRVVHRVRTSRVVKFHNLDDAWPELIGRDVDVEPGAVRCAQCQYDLRGTAVGGTCPECGHEVAKSIAACRRPKESWTRPLMQFVGDHPFLVFRGIVPLVMFLIVLAVILISLALAF